MSPTVAIFVGLAALLAIAGAMGIAYSVFRTSAKTNTVTLYERENDILEKQNARLEAETVRLEQRLQQALAEAISLREAVTQRAEVARLAEVVTREEAARREEHKVMEMLQKDLLAQLRRQRGEIG